MAVILSTSFGASLFAENAPDFGRDIRPILSNHCFQCHGADEEAREADLRLDVRDAAVEMGAINLDKLSESEILSRIKTHDDSIQMPPREANKPLSGAQISTLEKWIKSGADYSEHWAFQRIEKPEIPASIDDAWCRNEIDAFVLRKLKREGLTPSPEANREVLIRRLYQDLLGLLPDPKVVDAFLNDSSPDAYAKLVDRLLASPHYGERWGRHWLDQARYADSSGYTIDGPRIMWPYRDWVISAINADMPFDQFTLEQLAGDLLPEATKNQLVATAFHRNTMINQEGGVKADQFRNEALIDRTNTTGAVWLGLTVGCAQCHSHKFDPISHDEYYSMYAIFNGATDSNNVGPTVEIHEGEIFGWSEEQKQQLAELKQLRAQVAPLEKQVKDETGLASVDWKWQTPTLLSHTADENVPLKKLDDGSLLAANDVAPNTSYNIELQAPKDDKRTVFQLTAIRLRVLTDPSLPNNGPGLAGNGNFVLTNLNLQVGGEDQKFSLVWADHSQPKFSIHGVIDDDPKSGWAINVDGTQAKSGKKMNAPHEAILALAEPIDIHGETVQIVMQHNTNANYQVGRFAFDLSITPVPAAEEHGKIKAELAAIKKRVSELEASLPGKGKAAKQMVIKEQKETPKTYRLIRGDFLDPDEEAGPLLPTVPASLVTTTEMPKLENRIDFANWLTSRENPLTSRVTVNRVWGKYFGRGLVETENDFGFQGSVPSHPNLLDWLAVNFIENGWSMKKLHRQIVSSATYRQASDFRPELMQQDPGNYLLGRQSRFRVEAEIVRDQALAASGLLTPKLGGPSVHPPQPDGVYNFTQNKKSWPTETGPNRFRRTMYTMFYRSAPYPLLTTFDAPDFSVTCTRRARSNTPLQSLTMANDLVFHEFAQGLAKRVNIDESLMTDEEKCFQMFRLAMTRSPNKLERAVLLEFHQRESERFQTTPAAANEFVKSDLEGTDRIRLAALTSLARVIMNADEFMTRN